ncbi:MAG: DUF1961 family protein [Spirochaetota bacterium]
MIRFVLLLLSLCFIVLNCQQRKTSSIYYNPLANAQDIQQFRLEGKARLDFPNDRLRMQNVLPESAKQKANFVLWCPLEVKEGVKISFKFKALSRRGLAVFFFLAQGRDGSDLFSKHLQIRTGEYKQYHHGDIDSYHLSYYRRRKERDIASPNIRLRKSYGHHIARTAADPIQFQKEHLLEFQVLHGSITFSVDGTVILSWKESGKFGKALKKGKFGFRQMAPLVAEYSELEVFALEISD